MKGKERSCVRCENWFKCPKIEGADRIWKLPPEKRDLEWCEQAFECSDFK